MQCPYCGKEMKWGYIETGKEGEGLFFLPGGVSAGGIFATTKASIEKKKGIVLDGPYHVRGMNTPSKQAELCEECRKIVISY